MRAQQMANGEKRQIFMLLTWFILCFVCMLRPETRDHHWLCQGQSPTIE